jgi:type 1 glutamine amidotransferase
VVPDLVRGGQIRTFSRPLKNPTPIQKITIESFDNAVAPTFVGITAETGEATAEYADASAQSNVRNDGSTAAAASREFKWGTGIKTLIVGGGSSHDFDRWFNKADSAFLSRDGKASVNYTDKPSEIAAALKAIDVLYQSSNQKMADGALRKAIFDFADSGKGLLLVHPGLWYNWADWPEYNRVLCGGGARGHDRYGEFEVKLTDVKHAVTANVPASFQITDECYWFEPDTAGTPIQVLATGFSKQKNKSYPMVWIVQHPKARIVGIALGHDGKAHEHEAYQTLLKNALAWVAGK